MWHQSASASYFRIGKLWRGRQAQRAMDPEKRREFYFEFQDIVAENVPLFYTQSTENSDSRTYALRANRAGAVRAPKKKPIPSFKNVARV